MRNSLKFFLSISFKRSGIKKTNSGFTLIELLVAMVLAVLVITPLMVLMISMLDSDRREQAKATSEQEIQTALDFIARDLQQAVYIYDADGVTRDNSTTPTSSGIKNQIPPAVSAPNCSNTSHCTPVLVFWKREFIADSVGVTSSTDTNTDDGYAYSLVAYYLITNSAAPWSSAARIGRFQIRGPVNAVNANSRGTASDTGFAPPPLAGTITGASLKEKMNQWKNGFSAGGSTSYTQRAEILVDYISTTGPAITCATGQQGIGTNTSGFYACVNAERVLAQVHLRGNALARITKGNPAHTQNMSVYFPSASVQVQGRGFLFTK